MTTLVFTIVGADRAGLVAEVADIVASHDGNWERSELAELSGTFAGVVEVSVPAARADELRAALSVLEGLLTIVVQEAAPESADAATARRFTFEVIGNDRPGIVREITAALRTHGVSIDRLTTGTREAAMYGGRLFEASVVTRVPASVDLDAVTGELERLAAEIQVDVTLTNRTRVRIGVIGGGGAGLATTWLLEQHHDVTLYETQDRLGGHAHTVDVDVHGQRLPIDAGFQFFGPGPNYATFNRLLDALRVERTGYSATMSLTRTRERQSVALPPLRNGRPVWSSLTPSALSDLIRFRGFLSGIPSFLERRDTTVTTEAYIAALGMPASFTDRFLYPLLLALWCVDLPTLRSFAAYNTLHYFSDALSDGFHPPRQLQIEGGIRGYVDALARDLTRAQVRLASGAVQLERQGEEYVIQDAAGRRDAFDHVVVATNAEQAAVLLRPLRGLEQVVTQLERIEYFDTTIAIHGDRRLMPPSESAWSVVNARWNGEHSHLSVWDPSRDLPVFRSWVTYESALPEPLYATATYRHGRITPTYFDAQRRLKAMNGAERVWIAGLYMGDTDSHESAIRSAVAVGRELAPDSARLMLLDGESTGL